MKLPRFTLRELFLLVVIAAIGCGWWIHQSRIVWQLKVAQQRLAQARARNQIIWANQRQGICWIDAGSADGLSAKTLFSVYGCDEYGIPTETAKAQIEVTRISQPHQAECRILAGDAKEPILAGDRIFSLTWRPPQ